MKLFRIERDCYLAHELSDVPASEGQLFAATDMLVLPTPLKSFGGEVIPKAEIYKEVKLAIALEG